MREQSGLWHGGRGSVRAGVRQRAAALRVAKACIPDSVQYATRCASAPERLGRSLALQILEAVGLIVLALPLLASCGQGAKPSAVPTPTTAPAPAEGPAPTARETAPLPRALDDIALGMPRAAVEKQLGTLTCHRNEDGLDVCTAGGGVNGGQKLEVFFHRGTVVSLAHEVPTTGDVWSQLEPLLTRYGNPSLNGLREHDRDGRLHEVYGWKDRETLYSIRFVWKEDADQGRQLVATTVTLWDRKGYADWENDPARQEPLRRATPEVT